MNFHAHIAHGICRYLKSTILGQLLLIEPNSQPARIKSSILNSMDLKEKKKVCWKRCRILQCFPRSVYFSETIGLEVTSVRTWLFWSVPDFALFTHVHKNLWKNSRDEMNVNLLRKLKGVNNENYRREIHLGEAVPFWGGTKVVEERLNITRKET